MAEVITTTGGKERIAPTAALYKEAFRDDPVITYMLCNLSPKDRYAYLHSYFASLMTAAGMNGAVFGEADNFGACSVLMPPGRRVDNVWTMIPAGILGALWKLGISGCVRMLIEYQHLSDAAKAKALKGQQKYFYLFFIATDERSRCKGLGSALIKRAQDTASREGVPIWLESTTEYSWKLYGKLGFETVDKCVLGKGSANADGTSQKGGRGVPVWMMVWRPQKIE